MNMTLILAILAAASVLLIMFALLGRRGADPVQARLSQLGTMQAKTLEELELQQPFFDRSIRPLALKVSGIGARFTSNKKARGTEKRLAMAGNPYEMRTVDFLGLKVVVAGALAGLLFLVVGLLGRNLTMGLMLAVAGVGIGFIAPEMWLTRRIKARRKAVLLEHPGRPGPADHLRPRRPRLRRRAGQGGGEDAGPAHRRVPAGARRDPGRQEPPGCPAGHRRAHPGAGPDQLHRRHHPGRDAGCLDQQGAPDPVGAAAHRASSARRGDRRRRRPSRCCSHSWAASSRPSSSSSWVLPSSASWSTWAARSDVRAGRRAPVSKNCMTAISTDVPGAGGKCRGPDRNGRHGRWSCPPGHQLLGPVPGVDGQRTTRSGRRAVPAREQHPHAVHALPYRRGLRGCPGRPGRPPDRRHSGRSAGMARSGDACWGRVRGAGAGCRDVCPYRDRGRRRAALRASDGSRRGCHRFAILSGPRCAVDHERVGRGRIRRRDSRRAPRCPPGTHRHPGHGPSRHRVGHLGHVARHARHGAGSSRHPGVLRAVRIPPLPTLRNGTRGDTQLSAPTGGAGDASLCPGPRGRQHPVRRPDVRRPARRVPAVPPELRPAPTADIHPGHVDARPGGDLLRHPAAARRVLAGRGAAADQPRPPASGHRRHLLLGSAHQPRHAVGPDVLVHREAVLPGHAVGVRAGHDGRLAHGRPTQDRGSSRGRPGGAAGDAARGVGLDGRRLPSCRIPGRGVPRDGHRADDPVADATTRSARGAASGCPRVVRGRRLVPLLPLAHGRHRGRSGVRAVWSRRYRGTLRHHGRRRCGLVSDGGAAGHALGVDRPMRIGCAVATTDRSVARGAGRQHRSQRR